METIRLGRYDIRYKVRRANRRKNAHLWLRKNRELEVVLPKEHVIDPKTLVRKKQAWIIEKYEALLRKRLVFDGNYVLYRGKSYPVETRLRPSAKVRLQNGSMVVHFTDSMTPWDVLKQWMRGRTRQFLTRRMKRYSRQLGVYPTELHVEDTDSWGRCTKQGKLTFNPQLLALPENLAEYVVVHELAHLAEFNHSKGFRRKLATLFPDYVQRESALKAYVPSWFRE